MTEHRGYTCDGGCGAQLVLRPSDSPAASGWWTTFSPSGYPTLHCCSIDCSLRALQGLQARALPS